MCGSIVDIQSATTENRRGRKEKKERRKQRLRRRNYYYVSAVIRTYTLLNRFTVLFRDHPGETVPEENFWTLWCKGRLTKADTQTSLLGATPSGLTSAHLHHPPIFLQVGCPSCRPTNSVKALKAKRGRNKQKRMQRLQLLIA